MSCQLAPARDERRRANESQKEGVRIREEYKDDGKRGGGQRDRGGGGGGGKWRRKRRRKKEGRSVRADDPVYESLCHRGVKKLRENKGQTCTVIFVAAPPDKPPALPPPEYQRSRSCHARPSSVLHVSKWRPRTCSVPPPPLHPVYMRTTCVIHAYNMCYQTCVINLTCAELRARMRNGAHLISNVCIARVTSAALNCRADGGRDCVVLRARERFIGAHAQESERRQLR